MIGWFAGFLTGNAGVPVSLSLSNNETQPFSALSFLEVLFSAFRSWLYLAESDVGEFWGLFWEGLGCDLRRRLLGVDCGDALRSI